MTEVFDLDAVESEAVGEPFRFKFDGVEYLVTEPPDVQGATMLQQKDIGGAMSRLIGPKAWAKIMASDTRLDAARFHALFAAIGDHFGVDVGESQGSASSSENTPAQ